MSFCTRCGTPLTEGSAFCTKCGAPGVPGEAISPSAPANAAPPFIPAAVPQQVAPQQVAPQQVAKKGGHAVLIAVVAVILFAVVGGMAALVYAGYKVKQKATALIHSATSSDTTVAGNAHNTNGKPPAGPPGTDTTTPQGDDVDKGLDAIGNIADRMGFGGPPPDPYDDLEVVKVDDAHKDQCPAADTLAPADVLKPTAGRIPMREGLIVTDTWGRDPGDVDGSIVTSAIKPEAMTLTASGLSFARSDDVKGTFENKTHIVCAADLKNANSYATGFYEHSPEVAPGVTREVLSAAAFQELKETGKLSLRYLVYIITPDHSGYYKHWEHGELKRVEPNDIPYSVIVNDSITTLPAIHAQGILTAEGKAANKDSKYAMDRPTMLDLKVSDDPLNPLVLFFKFQDDPFRVEVTKIEFPNQEKKIEQELSKNKKAVVYGIYFDFNSDKIKPESKQVLDEIAAALKDNPDWKLTVDGHTDNIGGDAYNLDLSKRRSAAVKQALVTQYNINPDRLSSTGSGVAGAIDTNDTIIGRSHNRRVELTRQ
ncbi:MAG: OmpA family protein [Acidobacteriota bacterium]|nr:OmpA family protein [Acidobacteriota bacterium]